MSNIDRAAEIIENLIDEPHLYPNGGLPDAAAQALDDAGLLAPELPEPYATEGEEGVYATQWRPNYTVALPDYSTGAWSEAHLPVGKVWVESPDAIAFDTDHSEQHVGLDEARALALALLAAADHAEEVGTDGQDD